MRVGEVRLGVSHLGVLAPKHLKDRPARFGAFVVRLKDAALISAGQGADGLPETPTEDLGIESSCLGLLVGGRVGAMTALALQLCIIDQGIVVALVPEVHPLRKTLADVSGPLDSWCRLEYDGYKNQGSFGVPGAGFHPPELASEGGDESSAHYSLGHGVMGGGQVHHSSPAALPDGIAVHAAVEVPAIIVMGVVTVYGIQQVVDRCGDEAWQVGPLLH